MADPKIENGSGGSLLNLADLFIANRPKILRYLQAHGAGDAADDLAQDLYVRASNMPAPDEVSLGYVMRMAHSMMIDRARSARQRRIREQAYHESASYGAANPDPSPSVERTLLSRDNLREVEGVLRSLGSRTDIVLRRHRVDGVPQRAIAEELGISLSSVEKHLQRAYRAIERLKLNSDEISSGRERSE